MRVKTKPNQNSGLIPEVAANREREVAAAARPQRSARGRQRSGAEGINPFGFTWF